ILVLDSIHRRLQGLHRAEQANLSRKSKLEVARETIVAGTADVMFPILATTLTTIVAFLSFIFLSGRLALYYVPLAISVGTAMFASIFVAFAWIPVVLNQTWATRMVGRSEDGTVEVHDPSALHAFVEDVPDLETKPSWPQRLVMWSQSLWWLLIPAAVALMFWGHSVYEEKVIKGGFWKLPDQQNLIVFFRMPPGTDIRIASETMAGFEASLMPIHDGATMTAQVFGNQAYMEIEFDDSLLRSGIPILYRSLLEEVADGVGGTAVFIRGFAETPYIKGNLRGSNLNSLIKITGYNSKRLTEIAERNLAKVKSNRRVRNARISGSQRFGRASTDETVIALRREVLAEHGLTVLDVVGYLRRLLGVDTPWEMLVEGQQKRVQLSFYDADSIEFSDVAQHVLTTPDGERVQLGDLITMQTLPLSDEIVRENQRYSLNVNWEYVGTDRMRTSYIKRVLDSMDLPYGYTAEESLQQFLTDEEEDELWWTLILAAAFILIIMMALFESFPIPLLVLTSLPMALFGVFMIYWLTTSSYDSSAQIGLVLLFGV
ncbi:MAG: efflux RND transporter permease subunit, partial [bacterium]|nr:efflux RND transporter permease subunit [bacterium]